MGDLLVSAYREGGLILLLVVALCFISWSIIKHILKTNDTTLKLAMDAQEKWQKAIDNATNAIQAFREEVKSAHGYQREEHKEMIANLQEQGQILKRINGYKDK